MYRHSLHEKNLSAMHACTVAKKKVDKSAFLLLQTQKVGLPDAVGQAEVTSLCYNTRRILYTGTNSGHVCVWDCNTQRCFVTWEADGGEIGVCVCVRNVLITFVIRVIGTQYNQEVIVIKCFCVHLCRCVSLPWE